MPRTMSTIIKTLLTDKVQLNEEFSGLILPIQRKRNTIPLITHLTLFKKLNQRPAVINLSLFLCSKIQTSFK